MRLFRNLAIGLFALLGVAATGLALQGCQQLGAGAPAVGQQTPAQLAYAAELTFSGAVETVRRGVAAGAIRGENAAKAQAALVQAKAALDKVRAAHAASDSVAVLLEVRSFNSIVAALAAFAPPIP